MKKFLQSSLLTASLVLSSFYGSQGSAITGVALAPVSGPLIATGVCYIVFSETIGAIAGLAGVVAGGTTGGVFGGILGAATARPVEGAAIGAATGAYSLGVGGAIFGTIWGVYHGVVLLEGEKGQDFTFSVLDMNWGKENLKLSSKQVEAFNENTDSLNLIKEQVASELSQIENPQADDAMIAWENVRPDIEDLGIELETIAKVLVPFMN